MVSWVCNCAEVAQRDVMPASSSHSTVPPASRVEGPRRRAGLLLAGLVGHWPITAAALLLAILILPRLPPGVCFDDGGDLQAASRWLGVMHPPGYAGYVALGWVVAHIPGLDPAYAITLACALCGLTALILAARIQVHLGADPALAAAAVALAALHPALRDNLFAPEVYAPTLALLMGALLWGLRYAREGHLGDALLAAGLLGIALASRSPVVLMTPGLAIALWCAARTRGPRAQRSALLAAAIGAALPLICACAYLAWRAGTSPYSPLRPASDFSPHPPPVEPITPRRLLGLVAGPDDGSRQVVALHELPARAGWVLRHVLPGPPPASALALGLSAVGWWLIARTVPPAAVALAGIVLGAVVLLVLFHTDGTAADSSPIVIAAAIGAGVALSRLIPRDLRGRSTALRCLIVVAAGAWTVEGLAQRPAIAGRMDATDFLRSLDIPTLPAGTLIVSPWSESTALRYARLSCGRDDVRILVAQPEEIPGVLARLVRAAPPASLILVVHECPVPDGWELEPFRNLHRLRRSGVGGEPVEARAPGA